MLHKANFVYSFVVKVVKAWDNKRLPRKTFVPFSSEEERVVGGATLRFS